MDIATNYNETGILTRVNKILAHQPETSVAA
jgi:hypothetical protein